MSVLKAAKKAIDTPVSAGLATDPTAPVTRSAPTPQSIPGLHAVSSPSNAPDLGWMALVPMSLRLDAAEAVLASAAKPQPGKSVPDIANLASDLVLRCGLPPADASPLLQMFSREACTPPWQVGDIECSLDEAASLLPEVSSSIFGSGLVHSAAEVLDALGLVVTGSEEEVILRRGQREARFTANSKQKQLTAQFGNGLKQLFADLPDELVRAAAKVLALEPLPLGESAQPKDVFAVAQDELALMPANVVQEANVALRAPDLLDRMVSHVDALGYHTKGRELLVKAVILGQAMRLTGKCSMVTVRGESGSGKSQLVNSACDALPPEFVVPISRLSPKALVRRHQDDLRHRVVRGGERTRDDGDGNGEATSFVRQFISDGYFTYQVVGNDKDPSKCLNLRVDGPTAFMESTTSTNVFREDESRMLSVWLDASFAGKQELLRRILEVAQGLHVSAESVEHSKLVSWAIHRQLTPRKVLMPPCDAASGLLAFVDSRASDAPRQLNNAIALVSAHAVIHQHQRQVNASGALIATAVDIAAASEILKALQDAEQLARQSEAVFRIAQAHAAFGGEEFEASQLADLCEVEVRTANRWLKAWVRQGYVDRPQQAAGSTAAKYRITDAAAALVMPGRAA